MKPRNEIWISGATGRIESAVARDLARRGLTPTLLGRDEARLRELASTIPGEPQIVVAASSEVPCTALTGVVVPILSVLVSWSPLRNFAVRRLADCVPRILRKIAPLPGDTRRSSGRTRASARADCALATGWSSTPGSPRRLQRGWLRKRSPRHLHSRRTIRPRTRGGCWRAISAWLMICVCGPSL
jgi:hypothetical protein